MTTILVWLSEHVLTSDATLVPAVFRVSLTLILVWFAHFALASRSARGRILLWRLAAVGLLIVVAASAVSFHVTLPVLPAVAANGRAESDSDFAAGPAPANLGKGADSRAARVSLPATAARPATGRRQAAERYGFLVWAVGVAIVALRRLVGFLRLATRYCHALPVPSHVQAEATWAAVRLGYEGEFEIRHTEAFRSPCTFGAVRPRILIPTRQCNPRQTEELQASLSHEMAHCHGNDVRWNLLIEAVAALLWFHPLAWRMRLVHADACDEICDAAAAEHLGDGELYGRILAEIVLRLAHPEPPMALAMARCSRVRRRIMTVRRGVAVGPLSRWQSGGMIGVSLTVMLAIGVLTIGCSSRENGGSVASGGAAGLPLTITSSATGAPLLGATALFRGRVDGESFNTTVTMDKQGRGELRYDPSAEIEYMSMTVRKPGYVPLYYSWRKERKPIVINVESGEAEANEDEPIALPERLDLELANGNNLDGRVEDESGNPVAEATMRLRMPITWPEGSEDTFGASQLRTKQFGEWSWPGAPDDVTGMSVEILHPDYLTGRADVVLGSTILVVLKHGLKLEGHVRDTDGKPLEGAIVFVEDGEHRSIDTWAKTDAQGHYVLGKCKPGQTKIVAQAPRHMSEAKQVRIGENNDPIDFELKTRQTFPAAVVDRDDHPIIRGPAYTDAAGGVSAAE